MLCRLQRAKLWFVILDYANKIDLTFWLSLKKKKKSMKVHCWKFKFHNCQTSISKANNLPPCFRLNQHGQRVEYGWNKTATELPCPHMKLIYLFIEWDSVQFETLKMHCTRVSLKLICICSPRQKTDNSTTTNNKKQKAKKTKKKQNTQNTP